MSRAALGLLEQDDEFRPFALRALGAALLATGELEASAAMLRKELEADLAAGRPVPAVLALTRLALALDLTGHRREAETWCRRVLSAYGGIRGQVRGGLAYAAYRLGLLLYEANDLAGARYELERAWDAVGSFGQMRPAVGTAVADLALARLATGDIAGAFDAVGTIRRESIASLPPRIEDGLAEIEARLHVFAGHAAAAADWADGIEGRVPSGWPGLPTELTLARVRLAQRRSAQATRHLRSARALAERAGDVADLVSIGLLEAVLAERQGRRGAAQLALEGAIRLAAPEGYVRRVVDDGRAISRLLPAVRRIAPAFIDEVLAAVGSDAAGRTVVNRTHGTSPWRDERGDLAEALTARELEVLRLMAAGLGDAAIAEALVVSLATAKWHAAHVRSKLGARNRTHALVRARELGLV
jgi:LuxR family maltose regulon positive regulatory protein